jgi:Protein of unknown function (DUF3298)/Deacetylase PdaC
MALKKTACLLALALLGACLQACKSETAKSDPGAGAAAQNQTPPSPGSGQSNETAVPAPSEFKEVFVGVIDGKYAIRMKLERKGAELTGDFSYDQAGAVNSGRAFLALRGQIDGDGNALVANYDTASYEDENMRKDNEFKGKLDGLNSNGDVRLRFSGSWLRTNEKPAPFSLQQFRIDLGGLKLDEKKEESANKKLHYEIKVAAPQLAGADSARVGKFNQAVAKLAAAQKREFKQRVNKYQLDAAGKWKSGSPPYSLSLDYKVIEASKDFISVLFSGRVYYGGAHGAPFAKSFTYDLNRDAPLSLADLFTPNSDYLKVISDYSTGELKKLETTDEMAISFGAGPKVENFQTWIVTPVGLQITFDANQVGPYAAGEHVVIVPYSLLKPIIKPDGLLARFAK